MAEDEKYSEPFGSTPPNATQTPDRLYVEAPPVEEPHSRQKFIARSFVAFVILVSLAGVVWNIYSLTLLTPLQDKIRNDSAINLQDDILDNKLEDRLGGARGASIVATIAFGMSFVFGGAAGIFATEINFDGGDSITTILWCTCVSIVATCFAGFFQFTWVWAEIRAYQSSFEKFEARDGIKVYNMLYYGSMGQFLWAIVFVIGFVIVVVVWYLYREKKAESRATV